MALAALLSMGRERDMHLLAGLGNPGAKYAGNRHNVGFMVVDRVAERFRAAPMRKKFKGELSKADLPSGEVTLLKPMTYMNLSGESVQAAMAFFKLKVSNVIVVHDELDLDFGELRLKVGGGAGGHNGIKSITQHVGADFVRLRFGIGRPQGMPADRYVLSDFSSDERAVLGDAIDQAVEAIACCLAAGPQKAMNDVNRRT